MYFSFSISDWRREFSGGRSFPLASHHGRGPDLSYFEASAVVINSLLDGGIIHVLSRVESHRERDGVGGKVRENTDVLPVLVDDVTDLQGDFTRISNRVDVEDIKDDADEGSLGTTS